MIFVTLVKTDTALTVVSLTVSGSIMSILMLVAWNWLISLQHSNYTHYTRSWCGDQHNHGTTDDQSCSMQRGLFASTVCPGVEPDGTSILHFQNCRYAYAHWCLEYEIQGGLCQCVHSLHSHFYVLKCEMYVKCMWNVWMCKGASLYCARICQLPRLLESGTTICEYYGHRCWLLCCVVTCFSACHVCGGFGKFWKGTEGRFGQKRQEQSREVLILREWIRSARDFAER